MDIEKIIGIIFYIIMARVILVYIRKSKEAGDYELAHLNIAKARIMPQIAGEYGFTYKKEGIYHSYMLRQFKFNWDPFKYHNDSMKRLGKKSYMIPYSNSFDYLHGIYRGVEMTGSSLRFTEDADHKGYVYKEEKPIGDNEYYGEYLLLGYLMRYKVNKYFRGTVTIYRKNIQGGKYRKNSPISEDKPKAYFDDKKLDAMVDVYADSQYSINEISPQLIKKLFNNTEMCMVSFTENYVTVIINVYKHGEEATSGFLKGNKDYFPAIEEKDLSNPYAMEFMRDRFKYLLQIADYILEE